MIRDMFGLSLARMGPQGPQGPQSPPPSPQCVLENHLVVPKHQGMHKNQGMSKIEEIAIFWILQ